MIDIIAFDADDTLWFSETLYIDAHKKAAKILSKYQPLDVIEAAINETEHRNLPLFGYGVKGYILSFIEVAIELSGGKIKAQEIQAIIDMGRAMLEEPIRLFDHVEEVVTELSVNYPLMLITKGDLLDQQSKLERSGLADMFTYVEVVSSKTADTYAGILQKYGIRPKRFLMVGNAMKSDVLPVIEVGGQVVYIPYEYTWHHEQTDDDGGGQYYEIEHIGLLPELVERLNGQR
ncbi:MAG: HAD family hydrolase [Anaerolineae bacterium]|nr:HAD family hydrolase [Anaerolineae bacterium]